MEHVFFNKEHVFLEDPYEPCIKIKEKQLIKYLDLPVVTLNFYLEHLFNMLEKIGQKNINLIFKGSLNGYGLKELLDDMKDDTKDDLPFKYGIEVGWFTSTEFNESVEKDQINEFVRARGWNREEYFALGKHKISELKSLIININNRYNIEDSDDELVFIGAKPITVRMLIDSILHELTINKRDFEPLKKIKYDPVIEKKSEVTKAKIRIAHLNEELEECLSAENFEKCAEIRDEIEKCNKIIKYGK